MTYPNEVIKAIHTRRSVREYTGKIPTDEEIKKILEAGAWAPSGLNNQPWRFIVIRDNETKSELAKLTHYKHTLLSAPVLTSVFLDLEASYDRDKDLMAIGACNQNMLLAAHSLSLGAVWLGEILKRKEDVNTLLTVPETCELTAVIALGYPAQKNRSSNRKQLEELVYLERFGEPFDMS